jgi:hypothetical protein
LSRSARNRTGSNRSRPQAVKRSAGNAAAKPATPKPATPKPGTPGPGGPKGAVRPAAKSVPGTAPRSGPPRGRAAVTVPGRSTWATSAPLPALIAALLGLFLLGLIVGIGGALVHYMRVSVGGTALPTGTVLGVLAVGGVAFAGGVLLRSRLGAAIPSAGWLVAGMVLSSPKAEGDILIGGAGIDYGFLVGGVALLLAVCALPYGLLAAGPAADVEPTP